MIALNFTIFNVSILVAVIIEVTFAILLLFAKKQNQSANRFLAIMLLIIAAWMFWTVSLGTGLNHYFPVIDLIPFTFSLGMGPAIYFYVVKMCSPTRPLAKTAKWHFLPVALEIAIHFYNVFISQTQGLVFKETHVFLIVYPVIQLISIFSIAVYIFFANRLLNQFHVFLKANYSDYIKYQMHWLKRLLLLFILYELCWLPYTLVDYFVFDFKLSLEDYYPLHMMISIIGIWLAVESFITPDVLMSETFPSDKRITTDDFANDELASESATTDVDDKRLGRWLEQKMRAEKYYLEPELTLRGLALKLEVHPNNLSRILNKGLNKNFADYINAYRVGEVIQKLGDINCRNENLLTIAFASGFNSKTTFNRIFKKFTNQTPMQYKTCLEKQEIMSSNL